MAGYDGVLAHSRARQQVVRSPFMKSSGALVTGRSLRLPTLDSESGGRVTAHAPNRD
jgi:hypothetical protein